MMLPNELSTASRIRERRSGKRLCCWRTSVTNSPYVMVPSGVQMAGVLGSTSAARSLRSKGRPQVASSIRLGYPKSTKRVRRALPT